ncbi:MAG: hypothetical protein AB1742_06605 [bacterium]
MKTSGKTPVDEPLRIRLFDGCGRDCVFCAGSASGKPVSADSITASLVRGRDRGFRHVVFDGGEPAGHPEFTRAVAFAKANGFRRIGVVTGGAPFSDADFCRGAVECGLTEAAFVFFGDSPALHDEIARARGAFESARRGLLNVIAERRCEAGVVVPVCRLNLHRLYETIRFLRGAGARAFHLVMSSPAGHPSGEGRAVTAAALEEALPETRKIFRAAEEGAIFLRVSRFPAFVFEGWESQMPDARLLRGEAAGLSRTLFEPFLRHGTPFACLGEDCGACFLRDFCAAICALKYGVDEGGFDTVRVSGGERFALLDRFGGAESLWLRLKDAAELDSCLRKKAAGGKKLIVELESFRLAAGLIRSMKNLARVVVNDGDDLERVVGAAKKPVIEIVLNRSTAGWLEGNGSVVEKSPGRFVFSYAGRESFSAAVGLDHPLRDLFLGNRFSSVPVRDITRCTAPANPRRREGTILDLGVLDGDGKVDVSGFTDVYLRDGFHVKSLHCRECLHTARCPGLHVNYAKNFGFRAMEPQERGREIFRERARSLAAAACGAGGEPGRGGYEAFWDSLGLAPPGRSRTPLAEDAGAAAAALRGAAESFVRGFADVAEKHRRFPGDPALLPAVVLFRLGQTPVLRLETAPAFADAIEDDFKNFSIVRRETDAPPSAPPDEAAGGEWWNSGILPEILMGTGATLEKKLVFYISASENACWKALEDDERGCALSAEPGAPGSPAGMVRKRSPGVDRPPGAPPCCSRFLSSIREPRSRTAQVYESALRTPGAFSHLLNCVFGLEQMQLLLHVPCSFSCPASIHAARAVMNYHAERQPDFAAALEERLCCAVLFFDASRMIVLTGKRAVEGFAYDSVVPLVGIEMSGGETPATYFYYEIVSRLEEGNRVSVAGDAIRIFSGVNPVHALRRKNHYAGVLLDFTPR